MFEDELKEGGSELDIPNDDGADEMDYMQFEEKQ